MGIHIGNRNKIVDTVIAENSQISSEKKSWFQRHLFIGTVLAGILIGIIMMFSFWQKIVSFIETTIGAQ